jgi:hypothetical protein
MGGGRWTRLQRSILGAAVLLIGVIIGMLLAGRLWPIAAELPAPVEAVSPIPAPSVASPELDPEPEKPERDEPEWQPGDGTRMVSISVADERSCGVWDDGVLECWGNDAWGQSAIPDGLLFRDVSVGDYHACGITVDEVTHCWGELEGMPVVAPSVPLRSVRAHGKQQCGLTNAGSIICWGVDPTPHRTFGEGFVKFDVGLHGAICALDADGRMRCDGGSSRDSLIPPDGERFTHVAVGETSGRIDSFAAGVTTDGAYLILGHASPERTESYDQVPFLRVELGSSGGCALREDLAVICFGRYAAAGARPVSSRLVHFDLGPRHACGIDTDGKPVCWGSNSRGQSRPPNR